MRKLRRKIDAKRTFSVFVAIMFILSMVGAVYEIRASKRSVTNPSENFMERGLTSAEKRTLLASGKIVIEFERSSSCGQMCESMENALKKLSDDYKPYVFVSVFYGDDDLITLTAPYGREERYNISEMNLTMVERFICENSIKRPERCILNELM